MMSANRRAVMDRRNSTMNLDKSHVTIAPCAIIMVGLPARGKTYMARKLTRYLNWIGIESKVFNVGEVRRKAAPESINNSEFFRPDNKFAQEIREKCALAVLEEMITWLKRGGEVAVYDATNSNRQRRQLINDYLVDYKTFYVESVCFSPDVIEANIREVKLSSPDYINADAESAIEDFRQRIRNYEIQYESLEVEHDRELSFMKVYNQGEKFLVNRVQGHVQSRVVYYLMNIHVLPRTIYLVRHGETNMNVEGRIGGDDCLSENGQVFERALAKFIKDQNFSNLRIWTSLLRSTIQTVPSIDAPKEHWKALNEIDAGICEGMTYDEIMTKFPEEYSLREVDKYYYRYPSGESYQDLVARLEPVIMELERQENVMVICHQAVARCLLAYFLDKNRDELPYLEVPLHTVIKLAPVAYGCKMEAIPLNVRAVNTQRPKPAGLTPLSPEERRIRRKTSSGGSHTPGFYRELSLDHQDSVFANS